MLVMSCSRGHSSFWIGFYRERENLIRYWLSMCIQGSGLMESIPLLGRDKKEKRLPTISGVVPSLFDLPEGCLFSDRCPDVFTVCREISPSRYKVGKNHMARCLKYA